MPTINWDINTIVCKTNSLTLATDATQNLTLVRRPHIYYMRSDAKPKNIHEFIKGVILEKTIQIGTYYTYE